MEDIDYSLLPIELIKKHFPNDSKVKEESIIFM